VVFFGLGWIARGKWEANGRAPTCKGSRIKAIKTITKTLIRTIMGKNTNKERAQRGVDEGDRASGRD